MGDGVQQGAPSGGVPRFRIVPGPTIGENTRNAAQRNTTMTLPVQPQQYGTSPQVMKHDEMNSGVHVTAAQQHMVPIRQQQPAQCVVMNQGVPMNEMNGNSGVVGGSQPQVQHAPAQVQHSGAQVQHTSAQVQHSGAQVQHAPAQVQHAPAQVQHAPAQVQHSGAQVHAPAQVQHSGAQAQQPRAPSAAEQASMVSKCARFFKTLIHLSQQPDQHQGAQTAMKVTELVKLVIYGTMPPEAFTSRLQQALRSQAQPHLLPFLQKTLPALRDAMQRGEVVIEGIEPPQAQSQDMQNSQWDTPTHNRPQPSEPIQSNYMAQDMSEDVEGSLLGGRSTPQVKGDSNEDASPMEVNEGTTQDSDVRTLPHSYSPYRLLNVDVLTRKIQRALPEGGQVSDEVITMISQAAENRLRTVLARLSVIAEHRLEQLRNHPFYQAVDDTRRQLRFLEELDRREHERRENREKEALIRLSKSKSKDKDTLVEKAKQLQRADQEAARNRDANAAAIAALGGVKSNKRSWTDANNPFEQAVTVGISTPTTRPRTKRVTMRDLQLVLAQDPLTVHSRLRLKLSLFNTPIELHHS